MLYVLIWSLEASTILWFDWQILDLDGHGTCRFYFAWYQEKSNITKGSTHGLLETYMECWKVLAFSADIGCLPWKAFAHGEETKIWVASFKKRVLCDTRSMVILP